jgi:hypothetical protein
MKPKTIARKTQLRVGAFVMALSISVLRMGVIGVTGVAHRGDTYFSDPAHGECVGTERRCLSSNWPMQMAAHVRVPSKPCFALLKTCSDKQLIRNTVTSQ